MTDIDQIPLATPEHVAEAARTILAHLRDLTDSKITVWHRVYKAMDEDHKESMEIMKHPDWLVTLEAALEVLADG